MRPKMPWTLVLAQLFLWLVAMWYFALCFLDPGYEIPYIPLYVLAIAASSLMSWLLWRGHGWARVLLSILAAGFAWGFFETDRLSALTWLLADPIIAAALTFTPPSNRWFRQVREARLASAIEEKKLAALDAAKFRDQP